MYKLPSRPAPLPLAESEPSEPPSCCCATAARSAARAACPTQAATVLLRSRDGVRLTDGEADGCVSGCSEDGAGGEGGRRLSGDRSAGAGLRRISSASLGAAGYGSRTMLSHIAEDGGSGAPPAGVRPPAHPSPRGSCVTGSTLALKSRQP